MHTLILKCIFELIITNLSRVEEFINPLFKFSYVAPINKAIRALQVLNQIHLSSPEASFSDRFYRAVYSLLLRRELRNSSMHQLFLNLLFKILNRDASINRVKAFIKRLAQVIWF